MNEAKTVRHYDSPMLGPVRDATDDEQRQIEAFADACPVAMFGALNKRFNKRGLAITIDALPEPEGV